MIQQTIQGLFSQTREDWLDATRSTARNLLRTRTYITIDDVLAICPRPQFLHRNTTGQVFKHPDFKVYGFQKSTNPLANGRIICQWVLSDVPPPDEDEDEPEHLFEDTA